MRLRLACGLFITILAGFAGGSAENPAPHVDQYGDPLPDGAIARLGTVRWRCGGLIEWLNFSPDGKMLVGMDRENGRVWFWDAVTGKPLRSTQNYPGRVPCSPFCVSMYRQPAAPTYEPRVYELDSASPRKAVAMAPARVPRVNRKRVGPILETSRAPFSAPTAMLPPSL